MAQYISKSAVVAEIDRRVDFFIEESKKGKCDINIATALCGLNAFIDTLEVKEAENFIWNNARTTVPEDSSNQIICIKEDGLAVSTIGKIVNSTVKWAYLDDLKGNKL